MATYPFRLYCQRIDATKNMARYYALSMQPTLFGEIAVVRRWGRIGSRGGEKTEVFATEREAAMHFLDLARRERQKGYRPVGNCGNPGLLNASSPSRQ
ncbi:MULTISPECIES: WGR domain-containing protein [Neorhizobium]|uniref:WGR domain-containing protein n=1 Tax=Neorhizobium TaxID=1525371 RepID=UPI000CF9BBEE|nr:MULTISPECIES: WGR domain-containing protein [Neorhizobium]